MNNTYDAYDVAVYILFDDIERCDVYYQELGKCLGVNASTIEFVSNGYFY